MTDLKRLAEMVEHNACGNVQCLEAATLLRSAAWRILEDNQAEDRKMKKNQPAKKARRRPAPEKIYAVVWWYQGSGTPAIYYTSQHIEAAAGSSSMIPNSEVIAYTREVLPRTRTRKGER